MRCKYCGSKTIHPEVRHKTFSTGKAVAFGVVGAAAGMIGKDLKGYQCGQCGAFMESAMDFSTEMSVDSAVREAERGGNRAMYDYFKSQYSNIEFVAPPQTQSAAPVAHSYVPTNEDLRLLVSEENRSTVKHFYRNLSWDPDCPTYIDAITVTGGNGDDKLSMLIYNQSKKTIRSAYYDIKVYDDTFDLIETIKCVYQGIEVAPGQQLPTDKQFDLRTQIAYKVEVECEKVAFTDDEVWRNSGSAPRSLSEQIELIEENFPRLSYVRRDLHKYSNTDPNGRLYLPIKADGHWQCICRKPSLTGNVCSGCSAEYDKLEELLSQTRLIEEQKKAVMERASERAEETIKAYENARQLTYENACALAEKPDESSVKEAIALFGKLGDYKDSAERLENLNANLAVLLEKIEAERLAEEARLKEEMEQMEAEEKAAQVKAEKDAKSKKNGKYVIMIFAFVIDYLVGMLGITNLLLNKGFPMNSIYNYAIAAVMTAAVMTIAIILYCVFFKQPFKFGRLIRALISVYVLNVVYSAVQYAFISSIGYYLPWISFVSIVASLLIFLRAGSLYCKVKKKKEKKA